MYEETQEKQVEEKDENEQVDIGKAKFFTWKRCKWTVYSTAVALLVATGVVVTKAIVKK